MIARYLINCKCERPDWPFLPVNVPCGSSRTIGVVGLGSKYGIKVTGCRIRVTNADGVSLMKECVFDRGVWVVTFPSSHFQNFGSVKNGVVIFVDGTDERGDSQSWIERVGDLKVSDIGVSGAAPGHMDSHDVYLKSEIVDGVQHYKKEVLVYSERQQAWGADYVGDYILVGGEFTPYEPGEEDGE